jgi:Flp pilus assembly protein TadD
VVACAGLGVALLGTGCTTPPDARAPTRWDQTRLCASLQLANEHLAAGKFERARGVLAQFEGFPDPRLPLMAARMELEQGRYAAALQHLDRAGGMSGTARFAPPPEGAAWHRLRGIALEGLGRWGEAASAYADSFAREPSVEVLVGWIDALVLDGEPARARAILQGERQRFPGEPAVHVLAARLCEQMGDHEAAIDELATAALAQPEDREIRRRLAALYATAGRSGAAIATWQQLVEDSSSAEERRRWRHRLGHGLLAAGRFSEARQVFRTLAATQPNDLAAQSGLSVACLLTGEAEAALAAALTVLRAESDHPDARLLAALSYGRLGQRGRAVELLSDIPAPDDPDGLIRKLRARWE